MAQTVRITAVAHRTLSAMARQSNSSLQQVLEKAIENQRRRLVLEEANAAYAKLRTSKKAWRHWKTELSQLDATIADGI